MIKETTMTDNPRQRPDVDDPDPDPNTREDNAEQNDEGSQAQDVAADALRNPYRADVETERGGRPDPSQLIPDDTQDLVDHINDMDRSGRIDMGAFDGEDNMDDEDGSVPETGEPSRH
jgi:hypothetical protein